MGRSATEGGSLSPGGTVLVLGAGAYMGTDGLDLCQQVRDDLEFRCAGVLKLRKLVLKVLEDSGRVRRAQGRVVGTDGFVVRRELSTFLTPGILVHETVCYVISRHLRPSPDNDMLMIYRYDNTFHTPLSTFNY